MFKTTLWIGLALLVVGVASSAAAQGTIDKRTVLTFNQPVEVAGHVLPPGTYTFMLADPMGDRQIVEIRSADGMKLIAIVAAIPNYRLRPTGHTVVSFREMPAGSPEALRAWFYPGDEFGEEFVYPKHRAAELARQSNEPVPSMAAEAPTPEETRAAPITAVTPEEKMVPVMPALETTPPEMTPVEQPARQELPKTAGSVPLIGLLGLGCICVAAGLVAIGRQAKGRQAKGSAA
jgi:hypothetical protein